MLRLQDRGVSLCDGITRRDWLRIGGLGLGGLSLASLLSAAEQRRGGKAKSVIVLMLNGGPPQHESWDPKPEAPAEVRGEFGAISSKTPGLKVGELMPRTAQWTDRIAVLRAVVTGDNAHSSSGYQMLTGIPHLPLNRESAIPKPPNNWPSMGGVVRALIDDRGQLPAAVTLPEHIWNDGNFPWPGQDAGLLGRHVDPWLIHCQPQEDRFDVPGLKLLDDMSTARLQQRQRLVDQMNGQLDRLVRSRSVQHLDTYTQKAFDLLTGGAARRAFKMSEEPQRVRERYGMTRYGQSALLARRLVEAGVSLVQVNWSRIKGYENQGGWDTHKKHAHSLKTHLMPALDQIYTALLEDLEQRGLLDETLVLWYGEFGHTPKVNRNAGRDHWGNCFSIALAGGGVRGGSVHGVSDQQAAFPIDGQVAPRDVIATVFHCLGYEPNAEVRDQFNRPIRISRGRVIDEIL